MARRIVDAGYETSLWARRRETLEPFAGTGARIAASKADLSAECELVCICVFDDADVRDVVLGDDGCLGAMSEGSVLVVHSTVHPHTCLQLAERAEPSGVSVVDAPVSGGGMAAAARNLLVMVGADGLAFARCLPVFETFGDPVVHVGPVGTGQLAKLVNNIVWTVQCGVAADALTLGEGLGIDRKAMGTVLTKGSGRSYAMDIVSQISVQAIPEGLLRKDTDTLVRVATEVAADLGGLGSGAEHALRLMSAGASR